MLPLSENTNFFTLSYRCSVTHSLQVSLSWLIALNLISLGIITLTELELPISSSRKSFSTQEIIQLALVYLRIWQRLTQIVVLNFGSMNHVTKIWDSLLLRFGNYIEAYERFIDRVFTFNHLICKNLILVLWVTKLLITARLFKVWRLANHQLTHFVNKSTLIAR